MSPIDRNFVPEGMAHSDFSIGCEFLTESGRWRCTDVGTRTIIAIKIEKDDPSWYAGPPYGVVETVFDEYDIEACSPFGVASG
jgi:hypothetical protein